MCQGTMPFSRVVCWFSSLAMVFFAGLAIPAHAQSSIPRIETWITDGIVNAIAPTSDTIYLGGSFTMVGPYTGHGVPLSGITGLPSGQYPRVNGTVYACVADGMNGWYIGGCFSNVGGVARNNIAHIKANGAIDIAWQCNISGVDSWAGVYALAVSGSRLYLGGSFTRINSQPCNNLGAVDAATGAVTYWNPNANDAVKAIAVSGSTIYVGGRFTNVGGQTRIHIAAIDSATGAVTGWNPNANGYAVYTLAVTSSAVYVGGDFTNIGGQIRNNIAALNPITGAATNWNPNANSPVESLGYFGSKIYAGGSFAVIGGQTRHCIAALDAVTGNATAWNPDVRGGYIVSIRALAIAGSTVYAGGVFTSAGGQQRNSLAAFNLTTGAPTPWNPRPNREIYALAATGSTVYAGGDFTSVNMQLRDSLAALDAFTGAATDWNPKVISRFDGSPEIRALAVKGSKLFAAGHFTRIDGQDRNCIAAFNTTSGVIDEWNPNLSISTDNIRALAVSGVSIYIGGYFSILGSSPRKNIAALDMTTGAISPWNPNANGPIETLTLSGSKVYAGGHFTNIGGQARNCIAALDSATGTATSWNPDIGYLDYPGVFYSNVYAIQVYGPTVYVGGEFWSVGGSSRKNLVALNATTGVATGWNPNPDDAVHSLLRTGSSVYVGGNFWNIGGKMRRSIALLDASTGQANAWNPGSISTVRALTISGSSLYAGGDFDFIGEDNRTSFVQFDFPSSPLIKSHPVSQTVYQGATVKFSVKVTGSDPLAYQWRKGNINLQDDGRIIGSHSATLLIQPVSSGDAGLYSCMVSNALGKVTSDVASLKIRPVSSKAMDWQEYE